jgi:hypothetical protein
MHDRPTPPALSHAVVMIRPAAFAGNPETLSTNRFQIHADDTGTAHDAARLEFDALVATLEGAGVQVRVFEGNHARALPDEVFSNNWLSTHPDGTIVIYPMQAPSRRLERRADVVAWLERDSGYRVTRIVDLSSLEKHGDFLEGTGSAVIDHRAGIAYCGLSARTCERAATAMAAALDIEAATFETRDRAGFAVYHTNVLLALGPTFAVVCLDAIAPDDRMRIAGSLEASGRELVPITLAQMHEFAANLLAVESSGGPVIVLSTRAWNAYDAAVQRRLERHGAIAVSDVTTIERLGGGSVRCMLTEVWLPPA